MLKLIFKAYKKIDEIFFIIFFPIYITILAKYYQKTKERLSKKARERYQNLSEEEKYKKRQYARKKYRNPSEGEREKKCQCGRERYKNLLDDEKQWVVDYIKN